MKLLRKENLIIKKELLEHNSKMYHRSKYSSGAIDWEKYPYDVEISSKKEKELEKEYQKLKKHG